MSGNISASLAVAKIDKELLKEDKNGNRYLEIVLIPRSDKYGHDFMVAQSVSKEQRSEGIKGPILGNAKFFGAPKQQEHAARPPREPEDDDIPF